MCVCVCVWGGGGGGGGVHGGVCTGRTDSWRESVCVCVCVCVCACVCVCGVLIAGEGICRSSELVAGGTPPEECSEDFSTVDSSTTTTPQTLHNHCTQSLYNTGAERAAILY